MKKKAKKSYPYYESLVNKPITKYKVMAIVGGIVFIIGLIMYLVFFALLMHVYEQYIPHVIDYGFLALMIIGLILWAGPGLALAGVGIPCWIAMGVQQNIARKKLGLNKIGGKENGKTNKSN